MIRPWVKIAVAFSAFLVIGAVAFRTCGPEDSGIAPSDVALRGSEVGVQRGGEVRAPGLTTGTPIKGKASLPAGSLPSGNSNPPASRQHERAYTGSTTGTISQEPPPERDTTNVSPTPAEERSTSPLTLPGIAQIGGTTFQINSESVFPNGIGISSDAGTISFCVQPQWSNDAEVDASFVSTPNDASTGLQIVKKGEYLQFRLLDNNGIESGAATSITSWRPGERHLITATWGQERTSLYVDGQMIDQQTYQGQLEMRPDTPVHIGSRSAGARGSLSNLQIYSRSLEDGEVATLATGCR